MIPQLLMVARRSYGVKQLVFSVDTQPGGRYKEHCVLTFKVPEETFPDLEEADIQELFSTVAA